MHQVRAVPPRMSGYGSAQEHGALIDWVFLDLPEAECRIDRPFALPRNAAIPATIEFTKSTATQSSYRNLSA